MTKVLWKKVFVFVVISLFIGAIAIPSISGTIENSNGVKFRDLPTTMDETIFRVNNDYNASTPGYGELNFSIITDAVNKALAGDVIMVCNGTYNEDVLVNKKLTLEGIDEDEWGNDRNGSIVSGTAISFLIIGAGDTRITNFIIINSSVAGIFILNSQRVEISENRIQSHYTHHSRGVFGMSASTSIITRNNISHNWQGIYLSDSKNCHIDWNHIENSYSGIELFSCGNCYINRNQIKNISDYDIWLEKNNLENQVYENNFIDNRRCIRFRNSNNRWDANYWGDWWHLPFYIIRGQKQWEAHTWIPIPSIKLDENPHEGAYGIPDYC